MGFVKPGDQVLISISTILKFSAQGVYLSTQPWNVLNALFDSLLIISHHTHSQKPCVHIFTQELDADVVRTGRCGPLTHLTKPTHLRISWRKRPVEDYRKPFVSADIFGFIVDLKKKNFYCCYAKSLQPHSTRKSENLQSLKKYLLRSFLKPGPLASVLLKSETRKFGRRMSK